VTTFKVIVDGQLEVAYDGPTAAADALAAFEVAAAGVFKDRVELVKVLTVAAHGVTMEKLVRQRNPVAKVKRTRKAKVVADAQTDQ